MISPRHTLTQKQRRHLLSEIYRTLRRVAPELFAHHNLHRPGGLHAFEQYLDSLVEIVRETATPLREAHLAMILDRICEKCPYEFPSRYCPLRHIDGCILYRHSEPLIRTIARGLAEFGDVVPLYHNKYGVTGGC